MSTHVPGTPYQYRHGWIKLSEDADKTVIKVPIGDARRFKSQGFLWRSSADQRQLEQSIRDHGFDPARPLNVHPGIGLADGNHRLAAAERAGVTHVPIAFHKSAASSHAHSDTDTAASYGDQSFYDSERARVAEEAALEAHLDSPEYKQQIEDRRRARALKERDWLLEAAARLRREGNPTLARQAEQEAKAIKLANMDSWETLLELAVTPGGRIGDASPLGHKGGPRRLDDYVREVAHALMRTHGWDEHHAIAAARSAISRWSAGRSAGGYKGHPRPQVQAAAAAATIHQHVLDHSRRS